ncbi:MAG: SPOR domain-containing protein [Bdellovibrio bacteriovorus]
MREGAKQRLVGAVVIVALAVIFVPMLFEQESPDSVPPAQEAIPEPPRFDPDLKSEVFLGPEDSGIGGFDPGAATESRPLALPAPEDQDPAGYSGGAEGDPGALEAEPPEPPESDLGPEASDSDEGRMAPDLAPPSSVVNEPGAPRGRSDGMPSWVVQVASLGTPEAAAEMEAKLRKAGFSAFVEQADVRGKRFYRVRVGPELERSGAERTAARLREKQKLDTLIQMYP